LGQAELGIALPWRARQLPNRAWAQRYHGDFVQTMNFLDDSHEEAVARTVARRRSKRLVWSGGGAVFVAMLYVTLNLVLNWVQESREELKATNQVITELNVVAGIKKAHEDLKLSPGQEWSQCQPGTFPLGIWEDEDIGFKKQLCDEKKPLTEDQLLIVAFAEQLAEGDIKTAAASLTRIEEVARKPIPDEASGAAPKKQRPVLFRQFGKQLNRTENDTQPKEEYVITKAHADHAQQLIIRVANMESEEIRDERNDLAHLLLDRVFSESKDEEFEYSDPKSYEHPVHRKIASNLKNDTLLDNDEAKLLKTYWETSRWAEIEIYKQEVDDTWTKLGLANKPHNHKYTEVSWVYQRMNEVASEPESRLAALKSYLRGKSPSDIWQAFGYMAWSSLVLMGLLGWKFWRWGQRRSGKPIVPALRALRRAMASLFDLVIGSGFFILLGTITELIVVTMGFTSGIAEFAPFTVACLSALAYLLFCDAIRFKYCRSIGKILFDLRPVRDSAEDRSVIGLGISVKRNAPFIVALPLGWVLVMPLYWLVSLWAPIGIIYFALMVVAFWLFYAFDGVRNASDRWFGARWSKWLFRPLLALLFPPSWFLFKGSRTVGDRWSGTQVIDADSEESLGIELPPRYIRPEPAQAQPEGVA
jgi:hypothetical protein